MGTFSLVLANLKKYRKIIFLCGIPVLLSPMLVAVDTPQSRTAYAIFIMGLFWATEVTPLAVTSLLPLIIFPFLGILKAKDVCIQYMRETNVLLIGGLSIAIAIEQWNVHKRVALSVLMLVGVQPRRLMLGFMLVTAFLSMWMSNTATTAMMTPIMEAVLKELDIQFKNNGSVSLDDDEDDQEEENGDAGKETEVKVDSSKALSRTYMKDANDLELIELNKADGVKQLDPDRNLSLNKNKEKRHQLFCKAMLLSVCYSANIGGTGTLTGTSPQLVLAGQVDEVFPSGPKITFAYWFIYAFPQMLIFLLISWLYLQAFFMGISFKHLCFCFRLKKRNTTKGKEMYVTMKKQYDDLGPVTFAQIVVGINFVLLVLLWFFRQPRFIPGWGDFFKKGYVSDSTAAMVVTFLLFQLPSQVPDCLNFNNTKKEKLRSKTILDWDTVSTKFSWNVLFLLGAGFALAKACEDSGLSLWLSCQLSGLKVIPEAGIVFVICVMITFLTEITSNTATATILLPILASLAQSINVNPLYMMVPAATCATFAFMLPVATPPNAIVFATGRITIADMAKAGFGMNIIGILVVTLAINTWGYSFYKLGTFPDWAKVNDIASKCEGIRTTLVPNTTMTANATNITFW